MPDRARAARHDEPDAASPLRYLTAELFGTFALTFVAAGAEVIAALTGDVSPAARAVAPGLTVLAMIFAIGQVSGAHLNPAVSFAFALRGDFPWRRVPLYWLAQLGGALLAAGVLRLLFGDVAQLGATLPHHGAGTSLGMETVLTLILLSVILGTATQSRLLGPRAGLAVGAAVALAGLFAAPISGASMNPARSLGPAVLGGALAQSWIYVVGPLLGAVLAVLLMTIINGPVNRGEVEAARGDRQARADRHAREERDGRARHDGPFPAS